MLVGLLGVVLDNDVMWSWKWYNHVSTMAVVLSRAQVNILLKEVSDNIPDEIVPEISKFGKDIFQIPRQTRLCFDLACGSHSEDTIIGNARQTLLFLCQNITGIHITKHIHLPS